MKSEAMVLPTRHVGRGHLKSLDGVRGLAILMVVCVHVFSANIAAGGTLVRMAGGVMQYGFLGVDLFFVMSGFLITGILVDSLDDEGFFRKFYARRTLRIFPLYYAVLLLLFALTPLLRLNWNGMAWLFMGYLQNLRPHELETFHPSSSLSLNHFWSLAVEEQFYLVWPAVVFMVRDRRKLLATTLAISAGALLLRLWLVLQGVSHITIHVTTLTRADTLLLGGTLALLYRSKYWAIVERIAPWGFTAAAVVIVVSIRIFNHELTPQVRSLGMSLWIDGPRYTILAIGSACLIAWALRPGSACCWLFERRWLRFLGKYSYGLYVLHMVMLDVLLRVMRTEILRVTHSKFLSVMGAGVGMIVLSLGAAYLSFHLFEKPFLRMKKFFDYAPAQQRKPVRDGEALGQVAAAS